MFNIFRSASAAPLAVPESKSGQPLIALQLSNSASWTPQSYSALCREGFARNPVVHRCVRLISESAASVGLTVRSCETGAQSCLSRSVPGSSAVETLEAFYGYLQLSGTAYLKAVPGVDAPLALMALRPDRVQPVTDTNEILRGYSYDEGHTTRRYLRDPATGQCEILQMSLFNPTSDARGFSPLQASSRAVDLHNQGAEWAKALLENSARPSGALIYNTASGERLTDEQFERLKAELETQHTGPSRAGRPMVLEGGLDWKSMSLSPNDMDFAQTRRETARDIALAFGVPPMLLGLPGDNTYANYREANQAFWRQTIVPLVRKTSLTLEGWLQPWFGDDLSITPDLDNVPALVEARATLWAQLAQAEFITRREARAIAGLPAEDIDGEGR